MVADYIKVMSVEEIAHVLYDLVEDRVPTPEIIRKLETSISLSVGIHNIEEIETIIRKYKESRTGLEAAARKLQAHIKRDGMGIDPLLWDRFDNPFKMKP